jgi:hypothetical protein
MPQGILFGANAHNPSGVADSSAPSESQKGTGESPFSLLDTPRPAQQSPFIVPSTVFEFKPEIISGSGIFGGQGSSLNKLPKQRSGGLATPAANHPSSTTPVATPNRPRPASLTPVVVQDNIEYV